MAERVVEAIRALSGEDLAAMDASGSRLKVAADALRDALFFWLFLVTDRIPRESDDALGRAIRPKLAPLEALATAAS